VSSEEFVFYIFNRMSVFQLHDKSLKTLPSTNVPVAVQQGTLHADSVLTETSFASCFN